MMDDRDSDEEEDAEDVKGDEGGEGLAEARAFISSAREASSERTNQLQQALGLSATGAVGGSDDPDAVDRRPHAFMAWLYESNIEETFGEEETKEEEGEEEVRVIKDSEFCFLCETAPDDSIYRKVIYDMCAEWSEVSSSFVCRRMWEYYNTNIREYIPGKPEWAIKTIYVHFTQHQMDRERILTELARSWVSIKESHDRTLNQSNRQTGEVVVPQIDQVRSFAITTQQLTSLTSALSKVRGEKTKKS